MLLSEMPLAQIRYHLPVVRSLGVADSRGKVQAVRGNEVSIKWERDERVGSIQHQAAVGIEVVPPYWTVSTVRGSIRQGKLHGNLIWFLNGYDERAAPAAAMVLSPIATTLLFEPAAVMDALLLMRENLSEDKLYFSSRAEFEAVQLKLDDLIRQYENLI